MKILLLILFFGQSFNTQAQFKDLYHPLQNDTIYKKSFVKSRLIEYSRKTLQPNFQDVFNEKGQISKTIIYDFLGRNTPQCQIEYFYDSTGKLDSTFSKDLTGKYGYRINLYSEKSNEVSSKYTYNSLGKVIRKIDIGLNGTIVRETIYDANSRSEITRDFNSNNQLCSESTSIIENNGLLIKTEGKYNLYDSSKIIILKNLQAFEFNESGQITKSYDPTNQNQTVFKYIYDNKNLLRRILVAGPSENEAKVSYEFR